MADQSSRPANLQGVDERLADDDSIPNRTRTELRSAIRTFCRVVGRAPSEIVADPRHLRHLIHNASWQLAGISQGTWLNTHSRLRAALSHCGIDVDRKRTFDLTPEWEERVSHLPPKKAQSLGSFAGWCTARGIHPDEVNQEVFEQYEVYSAERVMRWDPRSHWLTARRLWNDLVEIIPDKKLPTIQNTGTGRWRGLPWNSFPQNLRDEVAAWVLWLAMDDLDDEVPPAAGGRRRRHRRPLKASTIAAYEYDLRAYCSHLVEAGLPVEDITSLAALTDPANVKIAFQHQLLKAGLAKPQGKLCFRLFAQINAVMAAARYLHRDDQTMALLGKRYNWVKPKKQGMSERKIRLLAQFEPPEVMTAFLELPSQVALELGKVDSPGIEDALDMQSAAALELLINWPARVGNLASLDFAKHIMRPPGGQPGKWRFRVETSEVKNEMALDRVLNEDSSALLEYYVRKFRPILLEGASSDRLFVVQGGNPKARPQLSVQLKRFVKRRLGLDFHPHLMRSLAGKIHLSEHQGHYVDVKNMLAHKNIKTTLDAYIGMEVAQSFALYDDALERRRGTSGVKFRDHRDARADRPRRGRRDP